MICACERKRKAYQPILRACMGNKRNLDTLVNKNKKVSNFKPLPAKTLKVNIFKIIILLFIIDFQYSNCLPSLRRNRGTLLPLLQNIPQVYGLWHKKFSGCNASGSVQEIPSTQSFNPHK